MKTLSLSLFILLCAIAALHAYWGLGGLWPGSTEQELIDTVVGVPGMTEMFSGPVTFAVAGLIFAAGLVALSARAMPFGPAWFARLGTAVLTVIFLGRGIMGYVTPRLGIEQSEPFQTLDLWLYSPLCLAIGLGFALLAVRGRG